MAKKSKKAEKQAADPKAMFDKAVTALDRVAEELNRRLEANTRADGSVDIEALGMDMHQLVAVMRAATEAHRGAAQVETQRREQDRKERNDEMSQLSDAELARLLQAVARTDGTDPTPLRQRALRRIAENVRKPDDEEKN